MKNQCLKIDKHHLICDRNLIGSILDFIHKNYIKTGIANDKQIYHLQNDEKLMNLKHEISYLNDITINDRLMIRMSKDNDEIITKKIEKEFQFANSSDILSICLEELMNFHEIKKPTAFQITFRNFHLSNQLFFTEYFLEDLKHWNVNIFEIFIKTYFQDFVDLSIQHKYGLSNQTNSYIYFDNELQLDSVIKFLKQEKIGY